MVAADWQKLGRHLGLENYTIAEIDADYKKVREKCAAVFDKWRKRYGFNLAALRETLLAIGRKDVIDSIPALKGTVFHHVYFASLFPFTRACPPLI